MPRDTLTITDNRTGQTYEVPIENGAIATQQLAKIKIAPDREGLLGYDPAFGNTASCKSRITFIDGERGILRYRGYPIEELAEKSTFLETAYLIVKGELPDRAHFERWKKNVTQHTMVHENVKAFMAGFRYDAHPMGMLVGTVGALSTFYPDAQDVEDLESRRLQTRRLIGKLPTIAAFAYRHTRGRPYVYPDNDLSYTGNFLNMLFRMGERLYEPDPIIERALDVLFILHADHEQNCSTNAVRSVGSSLVDPYSAVAAGIGALYGPRHGGANEAVVRMLQEIGSVDRVPQAIQGFKNGDGRLMGFGHRIYKNYDPRGKIIKKLAYDVFEATGKNPLIEIALELERIALQDDYFVKRRLYPNVDFYSGVIYQAMGFPVTMFPVLFAIARTAGWLAQWAEMVRDPEQRISRPRQIYVGEEERHYIAIPERPPPSDREDMVSDDI
ncbi:MAG: citrate synthase [Deltaproteobacteria bacterium]|nr:citrate synthase [Deltaproteobacteria bacterium]